MSILILTFVIGLLEGFYQSENDLRKLFLIASSTIMFIAFPKECIVRECQPETVFQYFILYSLSFVFIFLFNFTLFFSSLFIGKGIKYFADKLIS